MSQMPLRKSVPESDADLQSFPAPIPFPVDRVRLTSIYTKGDGVAG